jgi:hypothetical protein
MEEGVVLQRGSLVLCPFGGEEYCGVGDPFGPSLLQHLAKHFVSFFTTGKPHTRNVSNGYK